MDGLRIINGRFDGAGQVTTSSCRSSGFWMRGSFTSHSPSRLFWRAARSNGHEISLPIRFCLHQTGQDVEAFLGTQITYYVIVVVNLLFSGFQSKNQVLRGNVFKLCGGCIHVDLHSFSPGIHVKGLARAYGKLRALPMTHIAIATTRPMLVIHSSRLFISHSGLA